MWTTTSALTDSRFGTPLPLTTRLDARWLLTAEPGTDWFALRREDDVYRFLLTDHEGGVRSRRHAHRATGDAVIDEAAWRDLTREPRDQQWQMRWPAPIPWARRSDLQVRLLGADHCRRSGRPRADAGNDLTSRGSVWL